MLLQSFASWEIFLHFINHQLPSQIFKFLEPFVQNLHWACLMFSIFNLALLTLLYKRTHQRCSVKKGVLSNFTKFTGKHLCQGLFFNKVAGLRSKADSRYIQDSFGEKGEERDTPVGCSEAALHRCSYKGFWKYIADLREITHAEMWFQ